MIGGDVPFYAKMADTDPPADFLSIFVRTMSEAFCFRAVRVCVRP